MVEPPCSMQRLSTCALAAVVCIAAPRAAQAGNEEGVLFGAAASIAAGAVTATTSEGSALWYNPAGETDAMQIDAQGALSTVPAPLSVHEVGVNVGSTLRF